MAGRIILISGPCGAGKTTVARILAEEAPGSAVHLHTDDFYHSIRKGYIPPWLDGSADQNETVVEAAAAAGQSALPRAAMRPTWMALSALGFWSHGFDWPKRISMCGMWCFAPTNARP